jgi:EmrB/QacA subfamily drug resistance transporter
MKAKSEGTNEEAVSIVVRPDQRRWRALALLCLAWFMVILDASIVILALPSITASLGLAAESAQWVLSAYLLSFGGLLLLGGRLADLFGRRRMLMVGTALFLVASLACGLAWAGVVLIVARVVQGVSAAIMAPAALSILTTTFTEGLDRNRALGVWSAIGGIGATAALLIGGTLTDGLGWPSIFFINVPIALVLLALGPILLRESRGDGLKLDYDYDIAGAVTATVALVVFVYAVVEVPQVGWTSISTVGPLLVSAALLALFALIEARSNAPLVPPAIFRSRILVGGNLLLLLLGMVAWGMSLTASLYGQRVLGLSAFEFGLGTAVMTVGTIVGSSVGQAVVTRIGFRMVAAVGLTLTGIGCLLLTQVSSTGSYVEDMFPGLLVFGPGLGATFVAASVATLTGVAATESGLASALNTAAFQIGGALGAAVATTVAVSNSLGADPVGALTAGYQSAFAAAAVFSAMGLLIAVVLFRRVGPPTGRATAIGGP